MNDSALFFSNVTTLFCGVWAGFLLGIVFSSKRNKSPLKWIKSKGIYIKTDGMISWCVPFEGAKTEEEIVEMFDKEIPHL